MLQELECINQIFNNHFHKPMIFTSEDDQKFRSATKCHICGCNFIKSDSIVRDHNHFFQFFKGQHTINLIYFIDLQTKYLYSFII